jgi:WD40 repeat-containing protein SMU1
MTLEIESKDVVRLMLQFCKENGLMRTFEAMSQETQVTLNSVDSVESFVGDVREGRWDAVLAAVTTLTIPQAKLIDLYEQVLLECLRDLTGNNSTDRH